MKKFFVIFCINYVGMAFLLLLAFFLVPDPIDLATDDPLVQVHPVFAWVTLPVRAIGLLVLIFTSPSLFVSYLLTSLAPNSFVLGILAVLITLPISAALWAWIFIRYLQRWSRNKILIVSGIFACVSLGLAAYSQTHVVTAKSACLNNLRQIDAANNQWRLENSTNSSLILTNSTPPSR